MLESPSTKNLISIGAFRIGTNQVALEPAMPRKLVLLLEGGYL